jgi:hypothetical protein
MPESDDHDAELHIVLPRLMDTVKSAMPNCRPLTVSKVPPENGPLAGEILVKTGWSKLNVPTSVPSSSEMVTSASPSAREPGDVKQSSDVWDVHDKGAQINELSLAVGVTLTTAKLAPPIVTQAPPEPGTFQCRCMERTGASNEKKLPPEPIKDTTVRKGTP